MDVSSGVGDHDATVEGAAWSAFGRGDAGTIELLMREELAHHRATWLALQPDGSREAAAAVGEELEHLQRLLHLTRTAGLFELALFGTEQVWAMAERYLLEFGPELGLLEVAYGAAMSAMALEEHRWCDHAARQRGEAVATLLDALQPLAPGFDGVEVRLAEMRVELEEHLALFEPVPPATRLMGGEELDLLLPYALAARGAVPSVDGSGEARLGSPDELIEGLERLGDQVRQLHLLVMEQDWAAPGAALVARVVEQLAAELSAPSPLIWHGDYHVALASSLSAQAALEEGAAGVALGALRAAIERCRRAQWRVGDVPHLVRLHAEAWLLLARALRDTGAAKTAVSEAYLTGAALTASLRVPGAVQPELERQLQGAVVLGALFAARTHPLRQAEEVAGLLQAALGGRPVLVNQVRHPRLPTSLRRVLSRARGADDATSEFGSAS